jgi:putative ABC transport system permease protein
VLFVSLRDLQWRRRRFLIGIVATGLVFALAVVLTGISQSFINEVTRTTKAFQADQ